MRRWIVGVFACILSSTTTQAQSIGSVRLDLVTYKQLVNVVNEQHGKVVLVDFWADYCQPCKAKFPAVMALHRKYASQGFTVVSVSLDDVTDAETRERVKAFLVQQRAECKNVLLAEKPDVWVPRLKMNQIPTMMLFDRDGRLINRWTGNEIHLPAIEKRISELLATGPK